MFNMEYESFDKGDHIYTIDEEVDKMYLVQSGSVEIYTTGEKKTEFIIEKLFRGSIINHTSFLFKDQMQTNAVCRTDVTAFSMPYDMLKKLRDRNEAIDKALEVEEREQLEPGKNPLALDYIMNDSKIKRFFVANKKNGKILHNYLLEQQTNKTTLKLKNAIMLCWADVKAQRNSISVQKVVQIMKARVKGKRNDLSVRQLKALREVKQEQDRITM